MTVQTLPLTQHQGMRPVAVIFALLALFVCVMIVSVGVGSTFILPDRILAALLGVGERMDSVVVWNLRMPRVLLSMQAGACLALAGFLLQSATRNPLASPAILGIVDGAALGVVVFMLVFSDEANALLVSVNWQPVAAALGALVFAMIVGVLTWRDGRGPMRMILYGIAIAALASALVTILIIVGPVYRASQALIWLAGSVHAASWSDIAVIGVLLAVAVPFLIALSPAVDQLSLDTMSAQSTGLAVTPAVIGLVALAVFLTASAVSFVGGIAFVGLIAPHAARLLIRHGAGMRLIASALLGAIIVMGADILGRVAFVPYEVPVGTITAVIGAPYFIWLLIRRSRTHA